LQAAPDAFGCYLIAERADPGTRPAPISAMHGRYPIICHHDGALILPVGDRLRRCRPMDAELRARHREQPRSAEGRVRLERTPGPTRPAPGHNPLTGGVQGSPRCRTAATGAA